MALKDVLRKVETGWSPVCDSARPAMDEWGVLKLSAVTSGKFVASEAKRLPNEVLPRIAFEVRRGDVLMSRANGVKALVGVACTVNQVRPRLLLPDLVFRLVADPDLLDPGFLGIVLTSAAVRRQIEAAMRGTSGQYKVSQADVRALEIPRLPLSEQRDIVAAHKAFERRIGALERMLAKVEIAESALSAHALGQVGTAGPRLDSVATVAAGVTLGSELVGDGTIELPYLRVANVLDGRIDTTDVKTVRIVKTQYERYALRKGDLLLTEGGDLDKLGRGAVWDGRIDECLHQNHVFRVRCGEQMLPDFLALYAASPEGRAYFQRVGKQTTNLASINSTQVKQMPVPVPPVEEQRRLLGPVHAARERAAVLQQQIAKLRTIQQGVIEDLLSGRSRVNRT
ncbi:restriction endonuclease subunit S [Streptomyces sp. KMM 9044]|uniref:restriction endonuclease subunit S n=1 Tax=Streptomyces sp. KMM 9044 TaxID=2744474 RepID=UPI002150EDC2|nr:restriction endonuclease subunit S [Streptomyces sp. KMM 9044]WAX77803.1 restriction endonuclease subunit S [Streptomyces sp. KMM 9044]